MLKVLFVCAGNTCRSPMAEGLANSLFSGRVVAESAGMETANGMMAAREAVAVMSELDINISGHGSRDVHSLNLGDYDLVIALSTQIAQRLSETHRIPERRLCVLNVPDPYGKGITAYRKCLADLMNFLPPLFAQEAE